MNYNYILMGIFLMAVQSYGMDTLKPNIVLLSPDLEKFVGSIIVTLKAEETKKAVKIKKVVTFDRHGSHSINETCVLDTSNNRAFIQFDLEQYTMGQTMSEHDEAISIDTINLMFPKR